MGWEGGNVESRTAVMEGRTGTNKIHQGGKSKIKKGNKDKRCDAGERN